MKNSKAMQKIMKGEAVPWLWLDDGEEIAKDSQEADGKGGVILARNYNNGGPAVFLPKPMIHADKLVAASIKVIELLEAHYPAFSVLFPREVLKLRATIARAKGEL